MSLLPANGLVAKLHRVPTTITICDWFSKMAYPDGMEVEKDIQISLKNLAESVCLFRNK